MGRYEIEHVLGMGGMGEVFRARRVGVGGFSRPVALKRVLATGTQPPLDTLVHEALIAAQLAHPNVVSVYDLDRDEAGQMWLAMELVDGMNLRQLAERARRARRPMPRALVAYIGGEVLRALAHAHGLGIVHRDVSPHNVLLASTGAVKLSDFGIAKSDGSACSGTIKGKIAYLSPEQGTGTPVDGRSDLFSLGIVLYELLAGARPFHGETDAEVLAAILRGRPARLGGGDLEAVVMRLLASERGKRPATATAALRAVLGCDCYPADGLGELASFARAVQADPLGSADGPTVTATETASQDPERITMSRRSLRALAAAAIVSAVVAAFAWMAPLAPRGGHPGSAPARAATVERGGR